MLTDELIEGTIDSITGFVAADVAKDWGKPLDYVLDAFLLSKTYSMLCDKASGYYWDSVPELKDMFLDELGLK
ncbi:MAG: hypothetical protein LBC35_07845 [Coriobacteriales bacterium]|jgi:hypothetical protein|nr:hypothetical protein [Coriobacteriales bacterium]